MECQSRKLRNTQNNRQDWPWNTKWSRAKAKRVLSKEHAGRSKQPFPTTQETTLHMDITGWSISKKDYVLCGQGWRSSIQSAKQDLELTVAQITSSLLQDSDLN